MGIFSFLKIFGFKGKDIRVVKPFDAKRYLGKWYEIARMDFRFERNLNNTTAEYSFLSNGNIKVVNRGFDYTNGKWKEAVGRRNLQVLLMRVS